MEENKSCTIKTRGGVQISTDHESRYDKKKSPELFETKWNGERIIPKRIVIETVFGCNARCSMCPIDQPTQREKGFMPMRDFCKVVDALIPYRDRVKMFDLFGLGEPLLDPFIFDRINYVKRKGFTGLSISTNAHLLSSDKQKKLLESGIETIIFSIDGVKKETHEAIRARTDFSRVVKNATDTIRLRDKMGSKTRFVVRFIHQPRNRDEWEPFHQFWSQALSKDKGDILNRYKMHNWSGKVMGKEEVLYGEKSDDAIKTMPCHHIFEKLVILADGSVGLCFEDILDAQFGFGNAIEEDPIEVFNSIRYNKIRRLHIEGKRFNLGICKECTVLNAELARIEG